VGDVNCKEEGKYIFQDLMEPTSDEGWHIGTWECRSLFFCARGMWRKKKRVKNDMHLKRLITSYIDHY